MIPIDVVSTECLRPEICARSWASLQKNLKGVDWANSTLYLNIDPSPWPGHYPEESVQAVEDAAGRFFSQIVVRKPQRPCYPAAVRWGWLVPTRQHFLHWQADWVFLETAHLIEPLLAWQAASEDDGSVVAFHFRHSMGFKFVDRLCMNPFIDTMTARWVAKRLDDSAGPEAQLRPPGFRPGGRGLGVGLHALHWPDDRVVIRDIGREWMRENRLRKAGGSGFVTWESDDDAEPRP